MSTPPSCPCRASSIDVTGDTAVMSLMLIFWVAKAIWRSVTPISLRLPRLPCTVTSFISVALPLIFTLSVVCPVYLYDCDFIPMYENTSVSCPFSSSGTFIEYFPLKSVTVPVIIRFCAFWKVTLTPMHGSELPPKSSVTVPETVFCASACWTKHNSTTANMFLILSMLSPLDM